MRKLRSPVPVMEAAPTAGLTCRQVRLLARHLHEGGRTGGRFPFTFLELCTATSASA